MDRTRDDIGIFDISGIASGGTLGSPDYYNLPSEWMDPGGITHHQGTEFAVVGSIRDAIGIFDISGIASGGQVSLVSFFNLHSTWNSPNGIAVF